MEHTNLPEKQPRLTKEVVIAGLISETTKHNLQSLLSQGKNMVITRENMDESYQLLLKLYDIYKYLEEHKKQADKPDKDRIAARKEGYDSIMNPISELLEQADPILQKLHSKIVSEEYEKLDIINKQNEIKSRHVEFVNETTRLILSAPDDKELVRIQKLIGSEKSKTKFYGDYFPVISEVCDDLIKLIQGRKVMMKENASLLKQQQEAISKGDTALAVNLKEEMIYNENVIRQNAELLSHKAFEKVAEVSLVDTDFVSESVSPRLHRWSNRVDDIELLYQKMPELVEKVPNTKVINAFMKQEEEAGNLDKRKDNVYPGLTLFYKTFFVSVKKITKDAS